MTKSQLAFVLGAIYALFPAHGQGTFRNLNFEQANVPDIPSGQFGEFVPITSGLPGWTGYRGTNQIQQILHNNETLGGASISILGPHYDTSLIIEGNYTAMLQSGVGFGGSIVDTSIAQVGLIPLNTPFLFFRSWGSTFFSVSFDGEPIALSPFGSGSNYISYLGEVSMFVGQTGELRFTALGTPQNFAQPIGLDRINFSAVPEPSTWALVGLGCLFFTFRFWQKRGKQ